MSDSEPLVILERLFLEGISNKKKEGKGIKE